MVKKCFKAVISLMALTVILMLPICTNAQEQKSIAGYAGYNANYNLLFGLTEKDIYVSTGNFEESVSKVSNRELLVDGALALTSPIGGRWIVLQSLAKGANLVFNMGGYKTFDKFIMATGLGEGIYREINYNLHDFSLYYWDDYKWVEIPIPLGTDTNGDIVRVDFEPVTSCKFKIVSNQSIAFRIQEVMLMEPGVEPVYGAHKVESKSPATYNEITVKGQGYDYAITIPKRTYQKSDNKVVYRDDKWTTFVSSKEVPNIFENVTTDHDNQNETVEFTHRGHKIKFTAGQKSYIKDGKEAELKTAPYAEGTQIFVPIRDLIHAFDYYMSWNNETGTVTIYDPRDMLLPEARDLDYMPQKGVYSPYTVEINGVEQQVWGACNNDFVNYQCDSADQKEIEVKVTYNQKITKAEVIPASRGIKGTIEGNTFTFKANCNDYLDIEINGDYTRPLFVFLKEPVARPDESEGNVIYLDKDDVYEFQKLEMYDNTTIYLGHNTVLMTNIILHKVKNVKIIGNGIIISPLGADVIYTVRSDGFTIDGPLLPGYNGWKLKLEGTNNITIKNAVEFSTAVGGDGMDPTGCQNVVIDHMFTKMRDDAIAIKSGVKAAYQRPGIYMNHINDNILVQNCTYIAMRTGNPLEIGFELNGLGKTSNVTFRNIDIIRKGDDERGPNWRGAMTIHNSGSSDVENITYEDIRVDRCDEGFLCVGYFYVPTYMYDGTHPRSGINIKNITYKNISYNGMVKAPSWFFNIMRDSSSARSGNGVYLDINNPDYKINLENVVLDGVMYQGKHIDSMATAKECGFIIDPGVDIKFK